MGCPAILYFVRRPHSDVVIGNICCKAVVHRFGPIRAIYKGLRFKLGSENKISPNGFVPNRFKLPCAIFNVVVGMTVRAKISGC